MPKFFCDLHLHTKYDRSGSKKMDLGNLDWFAKRKGIRLIGTGDCMYPDYFNELRCNLDEIYPGLFEIRRSPYKTAFMLTTEICCSSLYKGKIRKIHVLILFPSFQSIEKVSNLLNIFGNIHIITRPMVVMSPDFLVKYIKDACPDCEIIPAHVMTPWFGLYGANGGYDSIEEAFKDEANNLLALETGLSADPRMVNEITNEKFSLVSFGDAHSPHNIGRELTALNCDISFQSVIKNIREHKQLFTVEFYPQMGKYFLSGCRKCFTSAMPEDADGLIYCPNCGRKFTHGVAYRVWKLGKHESKQNKVKYTVPLRNLIRIVSQSKEDTKKKKTRNDPANMRWDFKSDIIYDQCVAEHTEMDILLGLDRKKLEKFIDVDIVNGIMQIRNGNLTITPGYDGLYGIIKLEEERIREKQTKQFGVEG